MELKSWYKKNSGLAGILSFTSSCVPCRDTGSRKKSHRDMLHLLCVDISVEFYFLFHRNEKLTGGLSL